MPPSRSAVGRRAALVALALSCWLAAIAQASAQAVPDGPAAVVARFEQLLTGGSREQLARLLSPSIAPELVDDFAADFFAENPTRGVARERDRTPLEQVPAGDGFSLIVEFFTESSGHAQIVSARIDVQRVPNGPVNGWQVVDLERLSLVQGLYKLRPEFQKGEGVRGLTVDAEDIQLTLAEGTAFTVDSDEGITGLILIGRGEMRFAPPSATEKGQMRIFGGADALVTAFDAAFVRLNPEEYETRVKVQARVPVEADRRLAKRAQEVFDQQAPKSLLLDAGDFSREPWYLIPPPGDFISEIRTRKFGTLTYVRNQNQPEDIQLFNRERRRTISIYASTAKLAERGPFYDEDTLTDFDLTHIDLTASIDPEREAVSGVARLTIASRRDGLATLTLRLADDLEVSNITSPELGRLLFLRIANQSAVLVNLPRQIPEGRSVTLVVTYAGRVTTQKVESEQVAVSAQGPEGSEPIFVPEPTYLLSNRAYWYPQNGYSDYATARMRLTVPIAYRMVASGQRVAPADRTLDDLLVARTDGYTEIFAATDPVRYLTVAISRFTRVADTTISAREAPATLGPNAAEGAGGAGGPAAARGTRDRIGLTVEAISRQVGKGREMAPVAEDILRFYGTLMNDTPYSAVTLGLVENELPGGHSPGYAVVLNTPPPTTVFLWRNDPAAFLTFPEFFIAHELAHQWWGQAVGWGNYHEQWLSEGFAQYFSALYARRARGEGTFVDMLRQFRRWSLTASPEGPVYLGYRLGHVKNEGRVFRALVYNKGAAVLHMARRLLGDDVFFAGLRRFYCEQKFRKAGTSDLQAALEAESGRSLSRFFEGWIYSSDIPKVRYTITPGDGEVVVRFEQTQAELFDIPVTVTVTTSDGRTLESVAVIGDRTLEHRVRVTGGVRQVQVNRDSASLAQFSM